MERKRRNITKNMLGGARYIDLYSKHNKKLINEVFFTIEKRDASTASGFSKKYGYIKVTNEMRKIFNTLIQDHRENMHIEFIEWNDSYNVIFEDGVYISDAWCRLEKDDFNEWEKTIEKMEE